MKKYSILAITIFALTGCTTTVRPHNRIDTEARPLIQRMDSVLVVKQTEIGSAIVASNYAAQGGLVQALIDSEINKRRTRTAEEKISVIRDKMIDYDFGAKMEAELESEFNSISIPGLANILLVRAEEADYRESTVQASTADAVVFMDAGYKINANFDALVVSMELMVFPVTDTLAAYSEKPDGDTKKTELTDNILRQKFQSTIPFDLVADLEANADEAAKFTVSQYESMLDKAIAKISKQVAQEILLDDDYVPDAK